MVGCFHLSNGLPPFLWLLPHGSWCLKDKGLGRLSLRLQVRLRIRGGLSPVTALYQLNPLNHGVPRPFLILPPVISYRQYLCAPAVVHSTEFPPFGTVAAVDHADPSSEYLISNSGPLPGAVSWNFTNSIACGSSTWKYPVALWSHAQPFC